MAFESHSRNLISILPSCTFVVYGHPPPANEYLPVTNSVVKVLNSFAPSHSPRYVGHYDGSQQQTIYYYLPRSNVVRLITVGTDPTHGYNRFVQSASSWQYRVLGFGDQWNGGNMAQGPGGGKKILYLQEYLKRWDLPEYIVFTDCYDVVVLGDEAEVMETYQQHFDGKLVFGAEAYCWPDKDQSSQYPPTASMFKYLNSGLFMGPTKLIQELLATASVAPTDDDQRFYTTQFLQQSHPIVLDYNGVLFQNLAGTQASDFTRFSNGRVANKNGYRPCFLHGNGPGLPVLAELREEVPDIRVFLQRYQHEDIIYIPNPGNAGDSLIAFGTIQLFNELGLRWVFGSATGVYHDKLLFYAGGGNLVGLYDDCKIFLQNNKDNNNRIVVLPHTIKSEDALIKSLDSNVILFCRERTSFQYAHRLARHKHNVYLSKDMAFYIQNIDTYKSKQNNKQKVCHAFRMDCEQTNISIPDDNIDLSHHLNMPNNTQTNIEPVSIRIFEYLSKFDVVRTNRLHIGIAGHLLGKTVHFYPNSYYKNKAVYDYSLRDDANVLMSPKIDKSDKSLLEIKHSETKVIDPVIYLINLKTDVCKRTEMKQMFHKHHLTYRVFEGVEGLTYKLTNDDLQYLQHVDYDIHVKKGVVGCHLSHIRLLEQFTTSNQPYLIVCEDNVQLTDNSVVATLQKIQQLDFTMVFLCCTTQPPSDSKAHVLDSQYSLYNCGNTWYGQGTRCYIISNAAAVDILQKYYRGDCMRAIDWFYLDHIANPMVIYPSLCRYDGSNSAIEQRGGH